MNIFERLNHLENNIYYRIVQVLGHLVMAVAVLALAASIFAYLWSVTPTIKPNVRKGPAPTKEKYPELELPKADTVVARAKANEEVYKSVDFNMLLRYLPKSYYEKANAYDTTTLKLNIADTSLQAGFDRLKLLIPVDSNKHFWEGTVVKTFVGGARGRKLYMKTKNPKYIKYESLGDDFVSRFNKYAEKYQFSPIEKRQLLKVLEEVLSILPQERRVNFINNKFFRVPVDRIGKENLLKFFHWAYRVAGHLEPDRAEEYFDLMYMFQARNPSDGPDILRYFKRWDDSLPVDQRKYFLATMTNRYEDNYDNRWQDLKTQTDTYTAMLKDMPDDVKGIGLAAFYDLYDEGLEQLQEEIRRIDERYADALQAWEDDYQRRKQRAWDKYHRTKNSKENTRFWATKTARGSFVGIIIVSILLLIISTIRNLNVMALKNGRED